ncbi:hypothetical protein PM082_018384 [Marasmius tenuissimus]|nr:hypothetical protein PM082_018384 [Marasmius tenuissimus]
MWRDRRQGQVLARALEQCLEDSQPSPGDGDDWGLYSRVTAWDAVFHEGTNIVEFCDHERDMYWYFEKKDLLNKKFSPGKLWSLFCAADADVPDFEFEEMDYPRIGDVLAKDAKQKLTKWVPYDSGTDVAREDWYNVYQDPRNPKQYVIEDNVREFEVNVPTKLLLNSNFNLPSWFQKRLDRARRELEGWFRGPATYKCLSRLIYEPSDEFQGELDTLVDWSDNYLHLLCGNLRWETRNDQLHVLSVAGVGARENAGRGEGHGLHPPSPGLQYTSSNLLSTTPSYTRIELWYPTSTKAIYFIDQPSETICLNEIPYVSAMFPRSHNLVSR